MITWTMYAEAYACRYGARPPRNAKGMGQCRQLCERVGAEVAPRLAAWYVARADGYYARSMHPLGLLLRDAEQLVVQMWATSGASWEQYVHKYFPHLSDAEKEALIRRLHNAGHR
uniref:Uncharacterized protein n=1 Tax=uncultured prokaryote TaxID=198431 RepID=H5SEF8_9ZZZZ|nr:hypothetical protein HGMM_F16F12C10 [uncultured prokaryote]